MISDLTFASTNLSDRVTHHKILKSGQTVSYEMVLKAWRDDPEFSLWFSRALSQSTFTAFRWETPVLTREKASRNFEFVLVDAASFSRRRTNPSAFSKYFSDLSIATFPNLGGDSLMIVPCPEIKADVYGHFASFLRGAPESQIVDLWKTIGAQVISRLDDKPRWLSTAGGGVAWLHVRLDSRPKYYNYAPYRDVDYD